MKWKKSLQTSLNIDVRNLWNSRETLKELGKLRVWLWKMNRMKVLWNYFAKWNKSQSWSLWTLSKSVHFNETVVQSSFLSKIQNLTSEKTGKKILLLSWKKTCQNTIFGSSGFSFQFFISKFQGSGFSFQFLKNYHNLTIFYSDFEFFSGMLLPQK